MKFYGVGARRVHGHHLNSTFYKLVEHLRVKWQAKETALIFLGSGPVHRGGVLERRAVIKAPSAPILYLSHRAPFVKVIETRILFPDPLCSRRVFASTKDTRGPRFIRIIIV